jgi:PhnB protein
VKDLTTYLTFDGNCRQAMEFYKRCLGGELFLMPLSEAPGETPKNAKDLIMHANLRNGSIALMASDTWGDHPFQRGNNFSICISPESLAEAEKLFASLGEKGTITMALQDTFWGARFGTLTDQFGINWMVNFEKPK